MHRQIEEVVEWNTKAPKSTPLSELKVVFDHISMGTYDTNTHTYIHSNSVHAHRQSYRALATVAVNTEDNTEWRSWGQDTDIHIMVILGIVPPEAQVSVVKIDTRFWCLSNDSTVAFETIAHFKLAFSSQTETIDVLEVCRCIPFPVLLRSWCAHIC